MAFTWEQSQCLNYYSVQWFWKLYFKNDFHIAQGPMSSSKISMKPSDRVVSLSSFYSSCRQIQYFHQWYLHEIHRNFIHITLYECSIVTSHKLCFDGLMLKRYNTITHEGFPQKSKKKKFYDFSRKLYFSRFSRSCGNHVLHWSYISPTSSSHQFVCCKSLV